MDKNQLLKIAKDFLNYVNREGIDNIFFNIHPNGSYNSKDGDEMCLIYIEAFIKFLSNQDSRGEEL